MSSLDAPFAIAAPARMIVRLAAAALILSGLSACFRPLYGPTASGGNMRDVLASIEVATVTAPSRQERLTHYLRSELIFDLDGSGQPRPKEYKLTVSVSESIQTAIVETVSGRAESATLVGNADYKLTSLDGTRVLTTGKATSWASYNRSPQRFASVRAARDAEIRLAKQLSEQIKTRLAHAIATTS
jgi:LPS-assembly lipoprotein